MVFIKFFYLIFLAFLYSLEYLKMYQLNGYSIKFYKGTIKSYIKILIVSIVSFIVYNFSEIAGSILYGLLYLISMIDSIYFQRQKLNITNRLKRIVLVYIVILVSISCALIILFDKYFFLVLILIPILIHISNVLLWIVENKIQKKYIKYTKKILEEKNPYVIGITGSFGKTTVKNLIYEVLSTKYKVLKSPKNYNTQTGVCKTIQLLKDEEIVVMELGARHVKDIKKLCKIIDVNMGVVTSVGEQHLSTFKNIKNIYRTKRELQENLEDNGIMLFNDFDEKVNKMKGEFLGEKYGIKDFNFKLISIDRLSFIIEYENKEYIINSNLCLLHNVYNIMLAIKCGLYFGIKMEDIIKAIEKAKSVENRFNKFILDNGVIVIDDSYNSNYIGAVNAIKYLDNYKNVSKVVFSQGLVEQGCKGFNTNYNLGREIAKVADMVILLGSNKKAILKGLKDSHFNKKYIICIKRFKDIYKVLNKNLVKGDVLLIQNDLTDNY